ncbi:hypothetical protein M404DRAFT_72756, partial [Pisolithus tinctorius Marx 270]
KKKGEGLIAREVKGTVKCGSGSLMVWGCRRWNGAYVAILEQGLLQILEDSGIPEGHTTFQQGNGPKHTSRRAK